MNDRNVFSRPCLKPTSRNRPYELRKADIAFTTAWEQAEDMAADRLADEARRDAVDGVQEPLVSAGKLVRDDEVASGCC